MLLTKTVLWCITQLEITVLLLSQIFEAINVQGAWKNNKQTGSERGSLQWQCTKATNIDFKGVAFNRDNVGLMTFTLI